MATAVIYARVSTDEQAASGLGIDAQIHACRAWAARESRAAFGPFVDDGVSGATGLDRRPALIEALGRLGPGDVLLVAKRDRLGRDPIAVALIEAAVARKGSRVASAAGEGTEGDDPTNVLMRRMVDAFAEYERLVIKARTRAALASKRRRGERTGQVPWGVALSGNGRTLVCHEAELRTLADMRRWRAGGCSLRAIADRLTSLGIAPKNGGERWSHTTVRHLLKTTTGETTDVEDDAKGPEGGPD